MKKYLYYIWIMLSLISSSFGIYYFQPDFSGDNEFLLFTDVVTVLFFLPAYFVLVFGVILHLVYVYIKKLRLALAFLIILLGYSGMFYFLEYTTFTKIVLCLATSLIGFFHFLLSMYFREFAYKKPIIDL